MDYKYIVGSNRGIIKVTGPDRHTFLQGLITNDINKVSDAQTIYAALLTPQGKFLYDFFIAEMHGAFLIDCEADRLAELLKKLQIYKLRSDVTIVDASAEHQTIYIIGTESHKKLGLPASTGATCAFHDGIAFTDPRYAKLGARAILPAAFDLQAIDIPAGDFESYEQLRLSFGIPDGSRDMIVEKAIPLECGLDDLNAIDWDKGCYMGQELTARTKYRGLVRKRLLPVTITGPTPAFQNPVVANDKEVGSMRTTFNDYGIALLRLESLNSLSSGNAQLKVVRPEWCKLEN